MIRKALQPFRFERCWPPYNPSSFGVWRSRHDDKIKFVTLPCGPRETCRAVAEGTDNGRKHDYMCFDIFNISKMHVTVWDHVLIWSARLDRQPNPNDIYIAIQFPTFCPDAL